LSVPAYPSPIAIDGPAASGKSTIGRMLADHLHYFFLDTGIMYRATTLAALRQDVDIDHEQAVVSLVETLEMEIRPPADEGDGRLYTVFINGQDVTWDLRLPAVDQNVSQVSAYPGVRHNLVSRQREIARRGRVVMVGRDIGTVVLPDAPLKLYVIASAEERARRRWQEWKQRDESADYNQILADIVRRDKIDASRQHSPMRPADDALVIDTTGRSRQAVLEKVLNLPHFHRPLPAESGQEPATEQLEAETQDHDSLQ
jgi:CMP/dCMP kinase